MVEEIKFGTSLEERKNPLNNMVKFVNVTRHKDNKNHFGFSIEEHNKETNRTKAVNFWIQEKTKKLLIDFLNHKPFKKSTGVAGLIEIQGIIEWE